MCSHSYAATEDPHIIVSIQVLRGQVPRIIVYYHKSFHKTTSCSESESYGNTLFKLAALKYSQGFYIQ